MTEDDIRPAAFDLQTLALREAIRNLIGRAVDAVNQRDADAWSSAYAENGRWIIPSLDGNTLEITGRDTLKATWIQMMSGFPQVLHLVHSVSIDINGTDMTGRCYVNEHLRTADGQGFFVFGQYDDRYVQENGTVRFAERIFQPLYRGPADIGAVEVSS